MIERIHGRFLVLVLSKLIVLLGVVAHLQVVFFWRIPLRAGAVIEVALADFSAMGESEVVADLMHLCANEATQFVVVEGVLAVGKRIG